LVKAALFVDQRGAVDPRESGFGFTESHIPLPHAQRTRTCTCLCRITRTACAQARRYAERRGSASAKSLIFLQFLVLESAKKLLYTAKQCEHSGARCASERARVQGLSRRNSRPNSLNP
jgi:hypothetical protein